LQKKNIRSQIPSFYKGKKNRHNCLQYEKALKIFYFHILNVAKFGYVHLWDDPQCLGYGDNRDPETRSPSPDLWSPSSDLRLRPSDVSTSIGADDPSGDHLRVHTQDDRSLRVQQPACKLASCFQIFSLRLRVDCRLLGFNENSPAAQHLSILFFKKFKTNNPKFLFFSS
jgi:hypothetical protein